MCAATYAVEWIVRSNIWWTHWCRIARQSELLVESVLLSCGVKLLTDWTRQRYTNDLRVLIMGKFPGTVYGLMEWTLGWIQEWCSSHGLYDLIPTTLPVLFDDRYIKTALDSTPTWNEHVSNMTKKATITLNDYWADSRVRFGTNHGPELTFLCLGRTSHIQIVDRPSQPE